MELHIWRNIRIETPGDWEMLQFSKNMQAGRCAFADRSRYRVELSWRNVPGPPDFDRMLSDYESKLKEQGSEHTRRARCGPWHVLEEGNREQLTARFSRYLPDQFCLVEIVFPAIGAVNRSLAETIAVSVEIETGNPDGLRRWRAFGMDLLASSSLDLTECTIRPAHAELVFKREGRRAEERFARRGMVSEWLSGTVADWLDQWIGKDVQIASRTSDETNAHNVCRVSGIRKTRPAFGGKLSCNGAAWICPKDGRLYSVSEVQPSSRAARDPAKNRLSCCEDMKLMSGDNSGNQRNDH